MNKIKILRLLLAASLALNLALAAAYFYRRWRPEKTSPSPLPEISNDFRLTAAQKDTVREIIRKFKINSILFKEDILDKRVEIIEELGSSGYDAEKIKQKTEELNQLENQLNRDFIAALLKINEILEPSQRLNMIYGLSRNWFFFNRGPEKGGPHE